MMQRLILMLTVLALGACSTTFNSDVSTFHTLGGDQSRVFAITPMNPDKQDSIEYAQYSAAIVSQLTRYGYRPIREGEEPELIVGFDLIQSEGREQLYSRPSAGYYDIWHRGFFYRRAFYSRGFYSGFYGYGARDLDARTIYPTTLFVEFRDRDGKKLFEGRAVTDARSRALPDVVPLLAETMFADFPGPDGETRNVRLTLDEDGNIKDEHIRTVSNRRYNEDQTRGGY